MDFHAVNYFEIGSSVFNPGWNNADIYNLQLKGTRAIIDGVKKAGVKRLLFVGGSGSLEVKPGVQGVDLPSFPVEYKQGALATREALNMLRQEMSLDWSVLAPSADLFSGERTGRFRLGTDQLCGASIHGRLLVDGGQESRSDHSSRAGHCSSPTGLRRVSAPH